MVALRRDADTILNIPLAFTVTTLETHTALFGISMVRGFGTATLAVALVEHFDQMGRIGPFSDQRFLLRQRTCFDS